MSSEVESVEQITFRGVREFPKSMDYYIYCMTAGTSSVTYLAFK